MTYGLTRLMIGTYPANLPIFIISCGTSRTPLKSPPRRPGRTLLKGPPAHRKKLSKIDIWCLGEATDYSVADLQVKQRKPTSGGFGKSFGCHVFVDSSNIKSACDAMVQVSYPLSLIKIKKYLE